MERETRRDVRSRTAKGRWEGGVPIRTGLSGENVLVVKEVLHPCHNVVNVRGCRKLDALAVLIAPGVVKADVNVRN